MNSDMWVSHTLGNFNDFRDYILSPGDYVSLTLKDHFMSIHPISISPSRHIARTLLGGGSGRDRGVVQTSVTHWCLGHSWITKPFLWECCPWPHLREILDAVDAVLPNAVDFCRNNTWGGHVLGFSLQSLSNSKDIDALFTVYS